MLKLTSGRLVVTEIAPGVELGAHILDQSDTPLIVSPGLKQMDAALFRSALMGLTLRD